MGRALPEGLRGRLLALAVTGTLLAVLWIGCVQPLGPWYADRADGLERQHALLQRLQNLVETLPELRRQASGQHPIPSAVLEGGSDAVASAALQTIVQARATASGASVTSIETLPAETHGAYRRIGLRLSLSAPWPVLIELLRAIAEPGDGASAAVPNMVIDNLQFRAPPIQTRVADTPVTASFTVFAFRATPQEGAG